MFGSNSNLNRDNRIISEYEKKLDDKDEELSNYKTKVDLLQLELQNKDNIIDSLKEENELLQEKNKKWIDKLDKEIEKNN